MTCSEVRLELPAFLRGGVTPAEAGPLEEHLAACPVCSQHAQSLRALGVLLDQVPAPTLAVDLGQLYQRAARQQQRRVTAWRRWTGLFAAAAALALLAIGLRLELRLEPNQVTLRWNPRAVSNAQPPIADPPGAATPEQLRTLSELVHALARDVDARDQRQQQELAGVRRGLRSLQVQAEQRLDTTDRTIAALYATQLTLARGGERP